MSRPPAASVLAPHLPFKYVGGDPAVDLVNTVDWTRQGPVDDRLTSYERLTQWAEGAGLITARLGDTLRARADERPREAERAHRGALELRWTLRQIFTAIAHEKSPPAPAIEELNERVSLAMARLQLASGRGKESNAMRWSWAGAGEHLDSVLWPVVRSAAELLVSNDALRIDECGAEDCGWQFVDRSRNGLRRWCQMEVCGTREKSRRRALKRTG
jgi:predicted RNA-binding Zn ribbon-like protein